MAEIEMERRPRRSPWIWIVLLLVLAAVAVGAWLAFGGGGLGTDNGAEPAFEETLAPEPGLEGADPGPGIEPGTEPLNEPAGEPGLDPDAPVRSPPPGGGDPMLDGAAETTAPSGEPAPGTLET